MEKNTDNITALKLITFLCIERQDSYPWLRAWTWGWATCLVQSPTSFTCREAAGKLASMDPFPHL